MIEHTGTGIAVEVEDLDAAGVLEVLAETEVAERRAARAKLRLAARWCVLHPATAETGVATWGHTQIPGLADCAESLGGQGTPVVAAFTPEPFAAALGVSTGVGAQLLADALDLQHRLPRLWARVEALEVPVWRARRVAQATHHLGREAAGHVDRAVAHRVETAGPVVIDRAVQAATAAHEPEVQAAAEEQAKQRWGVWLSHGTPGTFTGTSMFEAVGDTVDLTRFHDLVRDLAVAMGRAGDGDPLEVRQAKALGVLADQQATLDLLTLTTDPEAPATQIGVPGRGSARTQVYLHASLTELLRLLDTGGDGSDVIAEVERLGPVTLLKVRDWLRHSRVSLTPVLDLDRAAAVDPHDPPAWMREQVIVRDRACVFPRCDRDARGCDLDHLKPYDPDGPPGQTHPENLAPLCRRHHRVKTHGRWRHRRRRDGTYLWTDPHGRTYLTHPWPTRDSRWNRRRSGQDPASDAASEPGA